MTDLSKFIPRKLPGQVTLKGQYVTLEPLDWDAHSEGLAPAIFGDQNADLWTYVPIGPFPETSAAQTVISYVAEQRNWQTLTIIPKSTGQAEGMASYMRLRPEYGSAEIGCVIFGQNLQKTRAATETLYLFARHIFEDLGYRRFEWKCDNANAASKQAAERFGFQFEGIFRNDMIVKTRNRDTAWFAMTDDDWPSVKVRYETWLSPHNFDSTGQQIKALSEL